MKPESKAKRSAIMARVRSKDTVPELIVRKLIFRLGYRYRLHQDCLFGKPDLVFAGRRKIIFVHGCFWHGHNCKRGARQPKSNADYWIKKIEANCLRDTRNIKELKNMGWSILIVWECEIKQEIKLRRRLIRFLEP